MAPTERDITVGKVVAPFGVKGELKVVVLTDHPERFDRGSEMALETAKGRRNVKITGSRPQAGGILLKLEGVDTRDAAEELRNAEFVIDRDEVARLEEGSFYVFDIIGLRVVTDDGRELGEVTEVLQSGANDVYITSSGVCIPALKDVVFKVDLENRVIVVRPVPGLLPDE